MGIAAKAMRGIEAIREMNITTEERIVELNKLRKLAPGPTAGCLHCGRARAEERLVKQFVNHEIEMVRKKHGG